MARGGSHLVLCSCRGHLKDRQPDLTLPRNHAPPPPQSLLLSAQKAAINPVLIRRKSTGAQTPQNRLLTLFQPFLIGRNDVGERRGGLGGGGSSLYSSLSRLPLPGRVVENLSSSEVTCYLSPQVRDLYYLLQPLPRVCTNGP